MRYLICVFTFVWCSVHCLAAEEVPNDRPRNFALGRTVTSRTEQPGNFRQHLTDGRLNTRYCPSGPQSGEWVTVDLKRPRNIANIRLHWEKLDGVVYRYIVETSADNENWSQVVDFSGNAMPGGVHVHAIDAKKIRYLRTTFQGATGGVWGSLWELEASPGKLPPISSLVAADAPLVATTADVRLPDGFKATMFGVPPDVNYPVCLTAAATGEVFVGVDDQGSLGKEPGRGKVLRCIDTDDDGIADQITEFARMDHPRGLVYDGDSLWVLHPPFLSVYRDTDGDGTSDENEILIEGISTEEVAKRGADHTTNGIRMGIDGWIYIAVGDFGFQKAIAHKDGTVLSRRGGGIVRIRPDGAEMEIYSWGQRNILDVSIDPLMNVFTRDNTNDGGGWDIRVSHVMQSANYGYPSLYRNFSEEIMPPLADYGGGSGCGTMYFQDDRWPEGFRDLLLTCDWGRSEVFGHRLPQDGATFSPHQESFARLPRPTDIDVDASGRMFVSSWKDGKFSFSGENIGFVARILPDGFQPQEIPDVRNLSIHDLVRTLDAGNAAMRQHGQREILRRCRAGGRDQPMTQEVALYLQRLAKDSGASLYGRTAAIYTLKQVLGSDSSSLLIGLSDDAEIREHCLRALADRLTQLDAVQPQIFITALSDSDPRVQAAALIGLGRLPLKDRSGAASAIIPLSVIPEVDRLDGDDWRLPHPERVIPHLAVRTLVKMDAVEECIAALNGPYRDGALWALKSMHNVRAVDGLFAILSHSREPELRRDVWTTLIRLYHREGDFVEGSPKWWGTRPDTTGPYYDRKTWSESPRIAAAVKIALLEGDPDVIRHLKRQISRHALRLDGISDAEQNAANESQEAIQIPTVDPQNSAQIANRTYEEVLEETMTLQGNVKAGSQLFRTQSCINCHTYANGQQPKGPHLVDIGKRYRSNELIESIVEPSRKIAQGFDTWVFVMASGRTYTGFVVLESAETVTIRQTDGLTRELLQDDIDERVKQEISMMPKGVVGNLTASQLADLIAYLQSLK